jgi:hypothetical protein
VTECSWGRRYLDVRGMEGIEDSEYASDLKTRDHVSSSSMLSVPLTCPIPSSILWLPYSSNPCLSAPSSSPVAGQARGTHSSVGYTASSERQRIRFLHHSAIPSGCLHRHTSARFTRSARLVSPTTPVDPDSLPVSSYTPTHRAGERMRHMGQGPIRRPPRPAGMQTGGEGRSVGGG